MTALGSGGGVTPSGSGSSSPAGCTSIPFVRREVASPHGRPTPAWPLLVWDVVADVVAAVVAAVVVTGIGVLAS